MQSTIYPYSTALLFASYHIAVNPITSAVLYILSFVLMGTSNIILQAGISAGFYLILCIIYKKGKIKPKYEFVVFSILSMVGFILLPYNNSLLEERIIISVLTMVACIFTTISIKAITEKGLKRKMGYDELLSIGLLSIFLGLGFCNLLSPYIYKGVSFFIILLSCYLFRFGLGTFISTVFGITFSIYYGNLEYLSIMLSIGMTADILNNISRFLSPLGIIVIDYTLEAVFGIYKGYTMQDFLPVVCSSILYTIIPTVYLKHFKDKLYTFREKQLIRQTINRNRIMLSNRLYELSGVFTEISQAIIKLDEGGITENKAKSFVLEEIYANVCKVCKMREKCIMKNISGKTEMLKMIDIGFAKGKLSLIDFPNSLGSTCSHPNELIFGINKMLGEFRSYQKEHLNIKTGRNIISDEAIGVSEILKGLALESGALLKYQGRLERAVSDALHKNGILASEVLIYGEKENTTISIIITNKEFSLNTIINAISGVLGYVVSIYEKNEITEDKCYMSFRKSATFDAVFGISKIVKDGSTISGDTHSVSRIGDDKFLVALSDGMGSGVKAQSVSNISLSLIESFYKAGLESSLILNTVNKLLSINSEDSFTALDISVINLNTKEVDFIKYGSPYGFILNDGTVKIVEGNSLPLGILNDLKPSVCHTTLNNEDTLLLLTDGVSDAFGSSSEVIDFLRKSPALNPQTLANSVISKALELSNGIKKDDMTALAVRIFKR